MLNQTTLKKIKDKYNLENLQLENKVDRGYLSNNYILKNKSQKFFLKQYRYPAKSKIKQILNIADFFHSHGIPTIKPLTNNQNKDLQLLRTNTLVCFLISTKQKSIEAKPAKKQ